VLHAWWEAVREPEETEERQIWDWVTGRVGGKVREQWVVEHSSRAADRLECGVSGCGLQCLDPLRNIGPNMKQTRSRNLQDHRMDRASPETTSDFRQLHNRKSEKISNYLPNFSQHVT